MGLKTPEIESLVPEIIEFADIGDYIEQPVRTYSSGMKARLGFAINVNIEPEILIVDEALSVGDKAFRAKCTDKIQELLNDKSVTFLFVTHATEVAKEFCSRGIVLKNGKMLFDSDVRDAVEYYNKMLERDMVAQRKKKVQAKVLKVQDK